MGSFSEVLFSENPCHKKTIQFIYIASQLSRKRQYCKSIVSEDTTVGVILVNLCTYLCTRVWMNEQMYETWLVLAKTILSCQC